jgi:hypothetical protein
LEEIGSMLLQDAIEDKIHIPNTIIHLRAYVTLARWKTGQQKVLNVLLEQCKNEKMEDLVKLLNVAPIPEAVDNFLAFESVCFVNFISS